MQCCKDGCIEPTRRVAYENDGFLYTRRVQQVCQIIDNVLCSRRTRRSIAEPEASSIVAAGTGQVRSGSLNAAPRHRVLPGAGDEHDGWRSAPDAVHVEV